MKKFAIVLGLSVSLLMACSQTPPAPTGTTTPAPAAATATPEPAGFQLKAGDEAIPFVRLKSKPEALYCVACQAKKEGAR